MLVWDHLVRVGSIEVLEEDSVVGGAHHRLRVMVICQQRLLFLRVFPGAQSRRVLHRS